MNPTNKMNLLKEQAKTYVVLSRLLFSKYPINSKYYLNQAKKCVRLYNEEKTKYHELDYTIEFKIAI